MQTLFNGGGIYSSGGYGAFNMAYANIDGLNTLYFGGQGGWVINHSFVVGGGGYGFTTDFRFDEELNARYQYNGGYGGVLLEFMLKPSRIVHVNFPMLIGGGGVRYTQDSDSSNSIFQEDESSFFIFEPGVELQVNLLPFMRIAFGARYKLTSNTTLRYLSTGEAIADAGFLRVPSANISFKFGRF